MFDKTAKIVSAVSAFFAMSGFLSGFALSNGLSQQEHRNIRQEAREEVRLLGQRLDAEADKVRRLENSIFGI